MTIPFPFEALLGFGWLGVMLLLGIFLRAKIGLLQRFLFPSCLIGGLLGIAGAAISRHFLGRYAFPTSFGILFLLCFITQVLSWTVLAQNREPARKPESEALPAREYWRQLPGVLRRDPNFCRYLVARALIVLGNMATALYVVYGRRAFGVDDTFAADLTMAALIAQTAATPLLGNPYSFGVADAHNPNRSSMIVELVDGMWTTLTGEWVSLPAG